MLSLLENPAIRARVDAISVPDYHTMIERGLLRSPGPEVPAGARSCLPYGFEICTS